MSVLDILKPSPPAKKITDEKVIKRSYRYWRIRTFYGMYLGYAFYYFSRKSFIFAMPAMIQDLGFDKAQLGILASILSITYGLSKFFSGILSDRSNPRYFMAFGLIITGILNILFGLSSTLIFFAFFWGLNGWFQGWGWPPAAKLLTHWYSQSERGRWWSVWNTSHNIGGAFIPLIVAYLAQHMGWRYGLYVPGISCILVGFFIMNRLRDTPISLGLPQIEKYRNDLPEDIKSQREERTLSTKEILVDYVLKNRFIWILALAYFFVYIIRTAINDWMLLFLVESKGYSYLAAGGTVFFFEIGGFLGSLVAGWASDYVFKGRRGPVNVLFSIFVLASILAFWKAPGGMIAFDTALMFLIGFFIFGPQMLIGMAAAELSHKNAAGTATGFVGAFAYAGAAFAGGPLGILMKSWGWDGCFIALCVSGVLSVLLLTPLWSARSNPKLAVE
ncbi:MAG: MFS transporter family glucose-6-phosphate receptor UhpC [Parachlamydiales bacterium]|nr:MFS transporter family glucose-6-phosphate receptor UhpC [Parachlamydiales bacterium]